MYYCYYCTIQRKFFFLFYKSSTANLNFFWVFQKNFKLRIKWNLEHKMILCIMSLISALISLFSFPSQIYTYIFSLIKRISLYFLLQIFDITFYNIFVLHFVQTFFDENEKKILLEQSRCEIFYKIILKYISTIYIRQGKGKQNF